MQHQLAPQIPQTASSGQLAEDLISVLSILRRGWVFIVVSAAVCLTLGLFHVSKFTTSYQSSARLLVLQQGGRALPIPGGDPLQVHRGGEDSLATHVIIIRSPIIIEQALASAGLKGLSSDSVAGRLTVSADPGTKVLNVGYTAGTRDEALKVIAGVISSYETFLKNNYQKNTSDSIKLMTKARDELNKDLERMEAEYLAYRQKNPSYAANAGGATFTTRRLEHLEQAVNESLVRSLQLRSQLDLGRKLLAEGVEASAVIAELSRLGSLTGDLGAVQTKAEGASSPSQSPFREQLEVQLEDVSVQRMTAARLLEHLRSDRDAGPAAGPSDEAVDRAFEAEQGTVELRAQLAKSRGRYNQVKRLSRGGGDPSVVAAVNRVRDLENELSGLRERRRPLIAAELSRPAGDEIVHAAEAELRALTAKEAALRDGVAQVKAERLANARAERERLTAGSAPSDGVRARQLDDLIARLEEKDAPVSGRGEVKAKDLIAAIEQDLKAVEAIRARVQEEYEKELPAAKKAEIGLLAESHLKNNLERHRTLFNSVVDQLKQAQLVSDFGSITAQTLNPPSVNELRQKRGFILFASLIGGAALGVGIAFVADQLDSRIRSLSEMRRALNLSVLGIIPALSRDQRETSGSMGLICHSLPRSFISEAYKSVRTNFEFLRRSQNAQVILVTSPQSGDGKSTTASNLAISLAHAGRKVLLVDADMRRPTQHHIHGLDRERGLPHVLKDVLPLRRAVQPSQVENLDLLLAGPEVSNPAELLASHHLTRSVDEMRQAYDVVIIDSPPLLAVADPSIIASAVDGVILVVRTTSTCRPDVERTVELLKTLGTPVLGAVINGITPQQMGARYGYRYRYGYGYGYSYGYGYGTYGSSDGGQGVAAEAAARPEITNGSVPH